MEKSSRLSSMIGKAVQVDRGGPESRYGKLLSVKPDHLVLHTEKEGVLYYKIDHVKSVTTDTKDYSDFFPETDYVQPDYLDAENFEAVLQNMRGRWVRINRGGPESVEGVLSDCYQDHLLLVINHEIVSVFYFHIRNISYVIENKKDEDKEQTEAESQTDEKERTEN